MVTSTRWHKTATLWRRKGKKKKKQTCINRTKPNSVPRDYRILFPTVFFNRSNASDLSTHKKSNRLKNVSARTYCLQRKILANFEHEHVLSKNLKGMKYRMLMNNRKYSSEHRGLSNKLSIFPNDHLFLTKRKKQCVQLFVFSFFHLKTIQPCCGCSALYFYYSDSYWKIIISFWEKLKLSLYF